MALEIITRYRRSSAGTGAYRLAGHASNNLPGTHPPADCTHDDILCSVGARRDRDRVAAVGGGDGRSCIRATIYMYVLHHVWDVVVSR